MPVEYHSSRPGWRSALTWTCCADGWFCCYEGRAARSRRRGREYDEAVDWVSYVLVDSINNEWNQVDGPRPLIDLLVVQDPRRLEHERNSDCKKESEHIPSHPFSNKFPGVVNTV